MFPLFLVIFGVDDRTKIYIGTFGALLAIVFNTAYGVMNARKTRVLAARVMGATRLHILLVVLLESAAADLHRPAHRGVDFADFGYCRGDVPRLQ